MSDKTDKTSDSKLPPSNFVFGVANLKPAISPKIINVTFPDGAKREFPQGTTGLDIAKGISPSLAKRTVAMALDGVVVDLADGIEQDSENRIPQPRRSARARTDPPRLRARAG